MLYLTYVSYIVIAGLWNLLCVQQQHEVRIWVNKHKETCYKPSHRTTNKHGRPVTAWIAMRKGVTGKEFTLTSWKTEIAKCRRARTTWTLCKRRTGEAIPRAAKFWRIDNSRAQSLNWDLWIKETITDTLSWDKIWQLKDPWWNKTSWDLEAESHGHWHFLEFGINLWSWPWNYWKVYVDTLPFKKIWDCWIAVCWMEVKSFALLLQSTNQRSKICWKRRKPTVQN